MVSKSRMGKKEREETEHFMGWGERQIEEVGVVRNRLMGTACLSPKSKVMSQPGLLTRSKALKQPRGPELMSVAPGATEGPRRGL